VKNNVARGFTTHECIFITSDITEVTETPLQVR